MIPWQPLRRPGPATGFLDHRGYEHVARNLDEAGRMLGGWINQVDAR